MLDEYKAYHEFSKENLEAEQPIRRIKFSHLSDHLKGLPGAMEYVARHALYHEMDVEKHADDTSYVLEACEYARNSLASWIGYDTYDEEETQLSGLLKYWMHTIGKDPLYISSPKIEDTQKKLLKRRKTLEHKQMEDKAVGNYNTLNETTYDRIIANALRKGPLQKYFLVGKSNWTENLYLLKGGKPGNKKTKLNKSSTDKILRIVAAWVLASQRYERVQPRFVKINLSDINQWAVPQNPKLDEFIREVYWEDIPVFEKYNIDSGKKEKGGAAYTKLKINESWLKRCDWHLIKDDGSDETIETFLKEYMQYTIYKDLGCEAELRRETSYENQIPIILFDNLIDDELLPF